MVRLINKDACLRCTFGSTESRLKLEDDGIIIEGATAATIQDGTPIANIPPFGLCSATKQACVPVTTMWMNTSQTVYLHGKQVITEQSILPCSVGGVITVEPKQDSVETSD